MRDREKLEPSSLEKTADAAACAWSARGTMYATSEVHKGGPSLAKLLALRLLRPGGHLVIVDEVTPNADVDTWCDALERARDPTHMRAYTLNEWRTLITEAGLTWIVGDSETRYVIDVESWLGRMKPSAAATRAVDRLFEAADAHTRDVFNIECDGARAVRFQMPMALILALKPV